MNDIASCGGVESELPDFDLLLASAFFLLSRYAMSQDARLGIAIVQHFKILKTHPECSSNLLKKNLSAMQRRWEKLFGMPVLDELASSCAEINARVLH